MNVGVDKIYGLRYDVIFKNVFRRKHLLRQFFRDIYSEEIKDIVYLDKETLKENKNISYGISDLLIDTNGTRIIWEMQNKDLHNMDIRIEMAYSREYAGQYANKKYSNIIPVKAFLILNYIQGKPLTLKEYKEIDNRINEMFGKYRDTRIWNIREALKKKGTIDYEYALLYNLDEFEVEKARKILKRLKKKKRFSELVRLIELYNADKEIYMQIKREEMKRMTFDEMTYDLRKDFMKEGIAKGLKGQKQGRKEGTKEGTKDTKKEEKKEIASNLLSLGIDIDTIMKATNLKKEQILDCQNANKMKV